MPRPYVEKIAQARSISLLKDIEQLLHKDQSQKAKRDRMQSTKEEKSLEETHKNKKASPLKAQK
jgi:hypothetical protein